jgi:hypothetical protein
MVAVSQGLPAAAKRCHKASHTKKHAIDHQIIEHGARRGRGPNPAEGGEAALLTMSVHAKEAGFLADAEWERVRLLLPTQEPAQGVRDAMTDKYFARYSGSWIPAFHGQSCQKWSLGPIPTAHGRCRRWCKEGLWSRIVEALGAPKNTTSTTISSEDALELYLGA